MSVRAAYDRQVAEGLIENHPGQQRALQCLDELSRVLNRPRYLRYLGKKKRLGCYLYGTVGVGKSYLMTLFEQQTPVRSWRVHFHEFMAYVHEQLAVYSGHSNPMRQVVRDIARLARVVCLDEMAVQDIGDAMLLAGLIHGLFDRQVYLVITSNRHPEQLYLDGIQRERFLPAIEAMVQRLTLVPLLAIEDFRLKHLASEDGYLLRSDGGRAQLEARFNELASVSSSVPLSVCGRQLTVERHGETAIWMTFEQACGRPRCQRDYLALAQRYDIFFISDCPSLTLMTSDYVLSWIHLIDVLYDQNKRLVICADVALNALYQGKRYKFLFQRTLSRLSEMRCR